MKSVLAIAFRFAGSPLQTPNPGRPRSVGLKARDTALVKSDLPVLEKLIGDDSYPLGPRWPVGPEHPGAHTVE